MYTWNAFTFQCFLLADRVDLLVRKRTAPDDDLSLESAAKRLKDGDTVLVQEL